MKLTWSTPDAEFRDHLLMLRATPRGELLDRAKKLANTQMDFVSTNKLDVILRELSYERIFEGHQTKRVRLAILSSCTTTHLQAAIRVAGIRRGIYIEIYEGEYGQYWQELSEQDGPLSRFNPTAILFALDAHHLAAPVHAGMPAEKVSAEFDEIQKRLKLCWQMAREAFGCHIMHQATLPLHVSLIGNNEHRLEGSKMSFVQRLNSALPILADEAGVDVVAIDTRVAQDGLDAWHDLALWHRAKQEISPSAAAVYGDLIGRLIAARQGLSYKCLVMDLDNTLWGGVIGDDGLKGIVLGQGSALGEAFIAFQVYARELSRRGIILAVCSKNDEANALEPFERHPEMILRRTDIAAFVANWSDKPENIRKIAKQLNIGLDSIVFVDDNPFERDLVRRELPMVAVPEVGEDPSSFSRTLADAGYFESVGLTAEDLERSVQYQSKLLREADRGSSSDLPSYLRSLNMELIVKTFDRIGLSRIVQLVNKTNQFNLTTRRYTDSDIEAVINNPLAFGLQLRLVDKFGDNGIISVVIGRLVDNSSQHVSDLEIDTWLMSCRVLGRDVEVATLGIVANHAKRLGARRLLGRYIATEKNGMVKEHYKKLGFSLIDQDESGNSFWTLEIEKFASKAVPIQIIEEEI